MPNSTNKVYSDITLYVDKLSNNKPTYIYAKQNDINSRFVNITIMGASGKINITGTPRLNATLPDGTKKHVTGVANEDGTVTVGLKSQILSLTGCVECDVSILSVGTSSDEGNATLTTSSFFVMVGESNFETGSGEAENDIYKVADVTLYGAKGDGLTDDTIAVYKAFQSDAERIYFPAGTYIVGTIGGANWPDDWYFGTAEKGYHDDSMPEGKYLYGGVRIKSNKIIYGDGAASTIIKAPNYREDKRIYTDGEIIDDKTLSSLVPSTILDLTRASNVVIRDLCLDGNEDNTETRLKAIRFNSSSNITIENCEIKNIRMTRGAIHDVDGSTNVIINRNDIHDCPQAISLARGSGNLVISNNYIHNLTETDPNQPGAINMESERASDAPYFEVFNNIIDGSGEKSSVTYGIRLYNSNNIRVRDNQILNCSSAILNCSSAGIHCSAGSSNIIIENNYCYHNGDREIDMHGQNSIIKDNYIEASKEDSFSYYDGDMAKENLIINNDIKCGKVAVHQSSTFIDIKDLPIDIKELNNKVDDGFKEINAEISDHKDYTGIINIKDFGAVGDGVNDDFDAINKAFQQAKLSKNKIVYAPPGNYVLSEKITLGSDFKDSPIVLIGSGDGTNFSLNIPNEITSNRTVMFLNGIQNLIVKNVKFTCKNVANQTYAIFGDTLPLNLVVLENVTFEGFSAEGSRGFCGMANWKRIRINDCKFINCSKGIRANTSDTIVSKCIFSNCGEHGIDLFAPSSSIKSAYALICDNYFEGGSINNRVDANCTNVHWYGNTTPTGALNPPVDRDNTNVTGLDNNNTRLTGVADGVEATDAVNMSQLTKLYRHNLEILYNDGNSRQSATLRFSIINTRNNAFTGDAEGRYDDPVEIPADIITLLSDASAYDILLKASYVNDWTDENYDMYSDTGDFNGYLKINGGNLADGETNIVFSGSMGGSVTLGKDDSTWGDWDVSIYDVVTGF